MEHSNDGYHISLFKPTTERARANRNMIVWLVSVWFLAIFGFHIVLRIIEKPTPEPHLENFRTAWPAVLDKSESPEDLAYVAQAALNVLGKNNLLPEEIEVIHSAVSWSLYHVTPDSMRSGLMQEIQAFESLSAGITDIEDSEYVSEKNRLISLYSEDLLLGPLDVRKTLLPLALKSEGISSLTEAEMNYLPTVMEKFMVHNRSALTDFRFLGFPFHYFYSAVFLLILFVGLCWVYCKRTDALNKKLQISE